MFLLGCMLSIFNMIVCLYLWLNLDEVEVVIPFLLTVYTIGAVIAQSFAFSQILAYKDKYNSVFEDHEGFKLILIKQ